MTDERNLQFNNLRQQIHALQAREHETLKFIRTLNRDEESIKPEYRDGLIKILNLIEPHV